MKVEIKIDSTVQEPKLLILTDRVTEEINEIVRKISDPKLHVLAGMRDDTMKVLEPDSILRVYASGGKVFAVTKEGEYQLRLRLYELEDQLKRNHFVRISNSEIINLKKVRHFDLQLAGTICVSLLDGSTSYVSRRYVAKIKEILGL